MHCSGVVLRLSIVLWDMQVPGICRDLCREMSEVLQKLNTSARAVNSHNIQGSENVCMSISVCVWIPKFEERHPCLSLIMHSCSLRKRHKSIENSWSSHSICLDRKVWSMLRKRVHPACGICGWCPGDLWDYLYCFYYSAIWDFRLGAGAFCSKIHANSQKVSALHLWSFKLK